MLPDIFSDRVWQMSGGERAAVEGVLAALKPDVAIEIGSMEGACLQRIAARTQEVHSFDLVPPTLPMPGNVRLHTGDSHELLPRFLASLAEQGRNVDLAIVDGDHTPEGVRQDIEDLLDSRAVAQTVVMIHDTANERVRRGLDAIHFPAWPKVVHVELDWIPGQLFAEPVLRNELWYGLGLVLVDSTRLVYGNGSVYEQRYQSAGPLLAEIRELVLARERVPPSARSARQEATELRTRLAKLSSDLRFARAREAQLAAELSPLRDREQRAQRALIELTGSASWKLTQPIRSAKRGLARFKR